MPLKLSTKQDEADGSRGVDLRKPDGFRKRGDAPIALTF